MPGPRVLGIDDVAGPVGEPHALGVAHLDREDRAAAIALNTAEHAESGLRCAVLDGLSPVETDGEALEVLPRHHVNDAADCFRTVERGGAVEDGVDPTDGDRRVHAADVDSGTFAARGRVRGKPVAIHHGHRRPGAEPAQVRPDLGALVALLVVGLAAPFVVGQPVLPGLRAADALERCRVGVDAKLERLIEDHIAEFRVTGHLDVDVVDDVLGRRQVEVRTPDIGSGDDHLLDFFVVLLVFFILILILGPEVEGKKR